MTFGGLFCILGPMIKHLLLDMDNTIYPASDGMDAGMTERMKHYVAGFLGLPYEEAVALRERRRNLYGTTLEWLKREHGLCDTRGYYEAIHPDHELEELNEDPKLRDYLLSLGLPMTLLTNGPAIHAERVLGFFGIQDIFLDIWDLDRLEGRGKPAREAFEAALSSSGHRVEETLFVDDYLKYLLPWTQMGGKGVQIDEYGLDRQEAAAHGIPSIRSIYELKDLLACLD